MDQYVDVTSVGIGLVNYHFESIWRKIDVPEWTGVPDGSCGLCSAAPACFPLRSNHISCDFAAPEPFSETRIPLPASKTPRSMIEKYCTASVNVCGSPIRAFCRRSNRWATRALSLM